MTLNGGGLYGASTLDSAIRSRTVKSVNGLDMHVLEAGPDDGPCVVLLHGFPELAYSWRKVLPALGDAGYHAVAPDQRGYGLTTGWDGRYDGDLAAFSLTNLALDTLCLVHALGRRQVTALVGHDFGSPLAACCALLRPDVFPAVALMSAPFSGPPPLPRGGWQPDIHSAMAALKRPRKHYQWYYSGPTANADMLGCEEGVHAFLRAYYHAKSADWTGNAPRRLAAWDAVSLAELPTYYIMDLNDDMPATVRPYLDGVDPGVCTWLTDAELAVYASEFERTGFQGALNWYRCSTDPAYTHGLRVFAGRSIDQPSLFIAGAADWGVYQSPGAFEAMQTLACTDMRDALLLPGAGHWVQQEQPDAVNSLLLAFLAGLAP